MGAPKFPHENKGWKGSWVKMLTFRLMWIFGKGTGVLLKKVGYVMYKIFILFKNEVYFG